MSNFWKKLVELKVFEGKKGQIYVNASQDVILVGLGKEEFCLNNIRTTYFNLAKELYKWNIKEVELELPKAQWIQSISKCNCRRTITIRIQIW